MPRPPRIDQPGLVHHVFNRGADRQTIFFDDCDRLIFGEMLDEVHQQFGVEVLAYCLMSNHYHLLLKCPDGGLSASMQRLGSLFTRRVNDRLGRDGALFRGRFGSVIVDTTEYLLTAGRYVHRNVLDIPGVHSVRDYRWSSHRTFLGLRPTPPFLNTTPLLEHFRSPLHFDEFVEHGTRQRGSPVTAGEIWSVVQLAINLETVGDRQPRRSGLERVVAAALSECVPDDVAGHLLQRAGDPADRTVRRSRQLGRDDPLVRRIMAVARTELNIARRTTNGNEGSDPRLPEWQRGV